MESTYNENFGVFFALQNLIDGAKTIQMLLNGQSLGTFEASNLTFINVSAVNNGHILSCLGIALCLQHGSMPLLWCESTACVLHIKIINIKTVSNLRMR